MLPVCNALALLESQHTTIHAYCSLLTTNNRLHHIDRGAAYDGWSSRAVTAWQSPFGLVPPFMGSCLSSPTKEGKNASNDRHRNQTGHHGTPGHSRPKPSAPDAVLAKYFEYVQQLGKGGTGDTGLFKDLSSGEEVAIKLIKRPLPKVIMPNILREVTVSSGPKELYVCDWMYTSCSVACETRLRRLTGQYRLLELKNAG